MIYLFIVLLIISVAVNLYFYFDLKKFIKREIQINSSEHLEEESFDNGATMVSTLIQISLYKMYKNNDILDFESLNNKIGETVNYLNSNSGEFEKWNQQYFEYLEKQVNDEDNQF